MASILDAFPKGSKHVLTAFGDESVFVSRTGLFGKSKKPKQCWETPGTGWATPASMMAALGWNYARPIEEERAQ